MPLTLRAVGAAIIRASCGRRLRRTPGSVASALSSLHRALAADYRRLASIDATDGSSLSVTLSRSSATIAALARARGHGRHVSRRARTAGLSGPRGARSRPRRDDTGCALGLRQAELERPAHEPHERRGRAAGGRRRSPARTRTAHHADERHGNERARRLTCPRSGSQRGAWRTRSAPPASAPEAYPRLAGAERYGSGLRLRPDGAAAARA
jgi:hypothetical protein